MDMLAHRPGGDYGDAGAEANAPTSIGDLIERLAGLARRQYRVFLIGPAAAIALGLLYLLVTPAKYTATATLLIDSSTLRVLQNQLQPQGDIPLDSLQVGSQVEVLASRNLGLAVISALKLDEDPEFIGSGSGLPSPFSRPGFDASTKADREKRALDEFLSHRTISRMERTYALNLSYTSRSPVAAAKIANAIADAYIDDQLGAKYQTISRAGNWLQDRIGELKAKVTAADRAVLEFKEKNNIVDFGGSNAGAGAGASSRLMGEQQLFELNSQLATARGATGEAKARLDRIEQVRKIDVGEAAVADSTGNVPVWTAMADRVRHGGKLSDALTASAVLPPVSVRMLRLGEETGQLPTLAARVAEFYEAKLQRQLDRIVGIIGPAAIVTISIVVGGLIVSVMTALLSVTQVVG